MTRPRVPANGGELRALTWVGLERATRELQKTLRHIAPETQQALLAELALHYELLQHVSPAELRGALVLVIRRLQRDFGRDLGQLNNPNLLVDLLRVVPREFRPFVEPGWRLVPPGRKLCRRCGERCTTPGQSWCASCRRGRGSPRPFPPPALYPKGVRLSPPEHA